MVVAMSSSNLHLLIGLITLCIAHANSQNLHKRFEYKYSFKPPYLAQKDGSVPFWEYGGNAIASGESVRLAPSLRSQKGAIWTRSPVSFDWWEVDVMFKVTGRGRVGADGLAFWYTLGHGSYGGEVFGAADRWTGLAVMFDSFDNDNKHNNPYIMAVLNDGTKVFDHKSDGSTQMLSGCLRDFRNKPYPTRARIEYYMNTLTVYFHNGMTTNEADYELCFRAENVALPRGGYFGLSAATGGLADDHDVLHFLTSSLHAQAAPPPGGGSEDQVRLAAEFAEYQKKLDQQKEDYRKDHPDEVRDREGEMEDWFESDGQRELRQIFSGQEQIHAALRELHKKVDEVAGKQLSAQSVLSALYAHAQAGQAQLAPGQAPPQLAGLPVSRHEWEALAANSQILLNTVAELKGFIIDVSRKSDSLLASGGGGAVGAGGGAGGSQQLFSEMRESIHQVKNTVAGVAQRLAAPPPPPPPAPGAAGCDSSCVSLSALVVLLGAQSAAWLLYSLYRERKEAQAKKFF